MTREQAIKKFEQKMIVKEHGRDWEVLDVVPALNKDT